MPPNFNDALMVTVVLMALAWLSGCAATPTFSDKTVCMRMMITDDDLTHTNRNGHTQNAYGLAWPYTNPCRVIIERKHYRNEVIGHETRHCFDGFFHSD